MSTDNPYSPPQAKIADVEQSVSETLCSTPRTTTGSRGWGWIAEGFGIFTAAPGIWVVNIIILVLISFVAIVIPIIGPIVQSLIQPVFTAGLMLGARSIDSGGPLTVGHLFQGFQRRAGALMGVGAIYFVGLSVIFVTVFSVFGIGFGILMGASGAEGMSTEQIQQLSQSIALAFLVVTALALPLIMMIWFAPALLIFHHEVGVFQAMKLSFIGCLKNIIPFLLYGLVGLFLAIVATIPLLLGWFVLVPVIFASIYVAYKDIFLE